jgi:hypothetical protein
VARVDIQKRMLDFRLVAEKGHDRHRRRDDDHPPPSYGKHPRHGGKRRRG